MSVHLGQIYSEQICKLDRMENISSSFFCKYWFIVTVNIFYHVSISVCFIFIFFLSNQLAFELQLSIDAMVTHCFWPMRRQRQLEVLKNSLPGINKDLTLFWTPHLAELLLSPHTHCPRVSCGLLPVILSMNFCCEPPSILNCMYNTRARLHIKTFPCMGIPMLKIRRSRDRLIFNMAFPILVRRHLYIETPPGHLYIA